MAAAGDPIFAAGEEFADLVAAMSDGRPLERFHLAEGRGYRVVVLTPDDGALARDAGCDAVFCLPFDPAVFVRQLTALGQGR